MADNLLNGQFVANKPNRVWLSDITYIRTQDGFTFQALDQALGHRKPEAGTIFHSDRGSQYAGHDFREILKRHQFSQSMSATDNCYDNGVTESFFYTLKTEVVYFERYRTRAEARHSIFEYIEVFYNRIRRHSFVGVSLAS